MSRKIDPVASRSRKRPSTLALCCLLLWTQTGTAAEPPSKVRTTAEILQASAASDWRVPDPEDLLYLDLAPGRVVIELAPAFAPEHATNIRALVRQNYFDGLTINRSRTILWCSGAIRMAHRDLGSAQPRCRPSSRSRRPRRCHGSRCPTPTALRPRRVQHRFSGGPRPRARRRVACTLLWHGGRRARERAGQRQRCGTLRRDRPRTRPARSQHRRRRARDQGHRVTVDSARGTGALGFYETPAERTSIVSMRVAADLPPSRSATSSSCCGPIRATFAALIEARRNRRDDWYQVPAGYVDLCNVPLPVRQPTAQQ